VSIPPNSFSERGCSPVHGDDTLTSVDSELAGLQSLFWYDKKELEDGENGELGGEGLGWWWWV
jgi:hypothetical protein